ncbi:MAG TPA: MFS transporter [Gaiellaceae bacterium]|nr:MFS transporter [Gaiellaceae bacterium]
MASRTTRAFAVTLASPALRRAQLSFGAAWASEWAVTVGIGVFAFNAGGAAAVGIVGLIRMVPAAIVAPFAATLADRTRREQVLIAVGLCRAVALALAAVLAALDVGAVVVYALIAVATIAQTLFRPAHSALLPSLCSTPYELTSANVVRGLLDSLATLVGPIAAAALIAVSGPAAVFAAGAAVSFASALLVLALDYEVPPSITSSTAHRGREVLEGLRTIAVDRDVRLLTALTTLQTFLRGCLTVFTVVVAIDLLRRSDADVGVLNAAVGVGAVAGSLLASAVVGTGGLARIFGLGVALWGAPLAALALVPSRAAALIFLAVVGLGNALVDVGNFTLLARLSDDRVMARVFAGFEAVITLGVAIGAAVTPVVIDAFGVRGALATLGLLAPAAVILAAPKLLALDRRMVARNRDVHALQRVPMLRPLPATTVDSLASALETMTVDPGATVFEQGQAGDRYYVIVDGQADVVQGDRPIARLRSGEGFGEIALLRACARTATVRAAGEGPLRLASLARDRFLAAVTGYSPSSQAGESVVAQRLEADRARDLKPNH